MLLDTHILIWTLTRRAGAMGSQTQALMQKANADIIVSQINLLEIKLKQRKGGLSVTPSVIEIENYLFAQGITILPLQTEHIAVIADQSVVTHADPFDLLLVAQAMVENLQLLTCDQTLLDLKLPGLQLVDGRL